MCACVVSGCCGVGLCVIADGVEVAGLESVIAGGLAFEWKVQARRGRSCPCKGLGNLLPLDWLPRDSTSSLPTSTLLPLPFTTTTATTQKSIFSPAPPPQVSSQSAHLAHCSAAVRRPIAPIFPEADPCHAACRLRLSRVYSVPPRPPSAVHSVRSPPSTPLLQLLNPSSPLLAPLRPVLSLRRPLRPSPSLSRCSGNESTPGAPS
ncbi:hypothetical protein M011DRAFT_29949 [Sporormia fimetaria CBS 119925]|uniref:Uncharacterized protein n=1 Tax=Sporormia fimetaria CBS 119925 TaxID=1340428 RepID=A0A6A6VFU6_9PLEO|nr:hypothetical protein M011DRAFT_29949 [Sporormia fimetaria CBS 119925]